MNSFFDLETFENNVIKKNIKNENMYILSKNFTKLPNSRIILSRLSIFDNEKRGTVKQDKYKVLQILKILMSSLPPEYKKLELDKLKVTKNEKRGIGCMLGMAIGDAMGATVEFQPLDYNYNKIKDMDNSIQGNFNLKVGQ